jgi:hypothetical protein
MHLTRPFLRLAPVAALVAACTGRGLLTVKSCAYDDDASPGLQVQLELKDLEDRYAPGELVSVEAILTKGDGEKLCEGVVRWTPGPNSGSVSPSSGSSDHEGSVRTQWTLPPATGAAVTLRAEVVGSDPLLQSVIITSTDAAAGARLATFPAVFPRQSAVIGQAVAQAPAVLVTTESGVPVPGVTVEFFDDDGSFRIGSLVTQLSVVTGPDGVARVPAWVLGRVGQNSVFANIAGGGGGVDFFADGLPSLFLSILAGDAQSASVNTPLPVPPAVVVRDDRDDPVAGVQIDWYVVSFAAEGLITPEFPIAGNSNLTGADGVARLVSFVPTTPGAGRLRAIARATGFSRDEVEFTFTGLQVATPTVPTLSIHAGNNQSAVVNSPVPVAPAVLVRNAQGFGMAGVTVTWQVVQGSGSFRPDPEVTPTSTTTNAEGVARLLYFTPTSSGTVKLRATVTSQHQVSPQFIELTFTGL